MRQVFVCLFYTKLWCALKRVYSIAFKLIAVVAGVCCESCARANSNAASAEATTNA